MLISSVYKAENKNQVIFLLIINLKQKDMKTITTISFLLVSFFGSLVAEASGSFLVSVTPAADSKALLSISNNAEQKYEIKISNSEGDMVYYHETKKVNADYNRMIDFSKFAHGRYKMEVTMDGAGYEKYLEVNGTGVKVAKSIKKTEPFFTYQDNMVILSHLNHGQEPVSVYIYRDGQLVFEKKLDNSFALNKAIDISKLDRGQYQVALVAGSDYYEYEVWR